MSLQNSNVFKIEIKNVADDIQIQIELSCDSVGIATSAHPHVSCATVLCCTLGMLRASVFVIHPL